MLAEMALEALVLDIVLLAMTDARASNDGRVANEWLRLARASRGMSQRDLEDESGLTQVGISHIESGRSPRPRETSKRLLAQALGYKVEELFPSNGVSPSRRLRALARKERNGS